MVKEQKHADITWRGNTLVQWYGSARKAELTSEHGSEPRLILAVTYQKDVPVFYEAQVNGPGLTCSGSGKTPDAALDEAREKILKLASLLQ